MSLITCNEAASVCKFMAEYKPVLLNEGLESLDGPENDKHALRRLQREVLINYRHQSKCRNLKKNLHVKGLCVRVQ